MKITSDNTTQVAQEKMITAGEILKTYREKKGLSLTEISTATKIPLIRLKQIESNNYGNFDTQVFTRGFIKNYAEYLGLNVGKVLAIYRRTTATVSVGQNKPAMHEQKIKQEPKSLKEKAEKAKQFITKFEFTPTTLATITGILLVVVVSIYLTIQFYNFQQPPQLSLITPEDNKTYDKDLLDVKGVTEVGSAVKVNDQVISTNSAGEFTIEIKLNEGQNKITVKAYKNNNESRAAVVERTVVYTKASAQTSQTPLEQQPVAPVVNKHTVQIEITDEPTWITLIVDNIQKIAWVVEPGKTDTYEFSGTAELTTGKPRSTKFTIDNKEIPITINSSGTGGKLCTVRDNAVNCE